jgi:hypothetical protein
MSGKAIVSDITRSGDDAGAARPDHAPTHPSTESTHADEPVCPEAELYPRGAPAVVRRLGATWPELTRRVR